MNIIDLNIAISRVDFIARIYLGMELLISNPLLIVLKMHGMHFILRSSDVAECSMVGFDSKFSLQQIAT